MSRLSYMYISTGMPAVDEMLGGGLLRGSVTILGGFPGVGKTTLATQWVGANRRSRLHSSEQPRDTLIGLARRVVPGGFCDNQFCILQDLDGFDGFGGSSYELDLVVVDSMHSIGTASPHRVAEKAQKVANERKLAVVLIAHLNKDGEMWGGSRAEYSADTLLGLEGGETNERLLFINGKHRHGEVDVPPVRMTLTAAGLVVREGAASTATH